MQMQLLDEALDFHVNDWKPLTLLFCSRDTWGTKGSLLDYDGKFAK